MPNDILKISDKRILIAGPITSFSYEMGYAFTSQGAAVCYFTPDIDKARRVCDTLNDNREVYRFFGRANYSLLNKESSDQQKALAAAVQNINGLDVYIDALNFFDPNQISFTLQTDLMNQVAHIFNERQRGRILLTVDQFLLTQDTKNHFSTFRNSAVQWVQENKSSLFQQNILAHILYMTLTEDCLLFLNPSKTINESLKNINNNGNTFKITKPDNISKTLIAAASDLMANINPSEFYIR